MIARKRASYAKASVALPAQRIFDDSVWRR